MSSSLSKLVDNLSVGIHNNKCADCKSNLDYIKAKNEKLILECYNCKQRYKKKFNKELIKRFPGTYEFCNNDTTGSTAEPSSSERINKFILLLRKVFILTNIWIIGKDLMKFHCLVKNHFIAT